jgi:hypothetical protein
VVASRAATLIARGQIGGGGENDTRVFFDRARFVPAGAHPGRPSDPTARVEASMLTGHSAFLGSIRGWVSAQICGPRASLTYQRPLGGIL